MRRIVGIALLLLGVLNAPSTASAAPCVQQGIRAGGAHAIAVVRQGQTLVACDGRAITGFRPVTVPGLSGTLHSSETRVDGLVGAPQLLDGHYSAGGHADLAKLDRRLETQRARYAWVRLVVGLILGILALVAPRRSVTGAAAAIAAALVLSALGSSSIVLLALLTIAGAFLPWRALWLFFAAYLVVLVASPETQSLALLGPHPWGGGRFYGMTNELETLVLAPAVVLGLPAAPLVLLTVGWSRAGSDGGGLLTFLGAYVWLSGRPRVAALAALALAVAFVLLDAATGGSNHVTHSLLHGGLLHDVWHRWAVSWHGATASVWRVVMCAASLAALVWVATRRPRNRKVDAFLVALLVSLVANDTPQDVLLWGAITGVGLRRAV